MKKTTFVLDEAASLGSNFQPVIDALDKYRAYGVRLQLYYQSIGQLKTCFPTDGGQTLLSNCAKVVFSLSDLESAKLFSAMLGRETIEVRSGGRSWGKSSSFSYGKGDESRGQNWGGSNSAREQSRDVYQHEELLSLPRNVCLTFIPGLHPVKTTLVRYYENNWQFKHSAGYVLLRSLVFFLVAWFFVYAALTFMLELHVIERYVLFFRSLQRRI